MYEITLGRNETDLKKFGSEATIPLGKHYVEMERVKSLANPVYLDVNRPHAILVCGKRGSGKCLEENTLITLNNGRVIPIKDLEKNIDCVVALDNNLKMTSALKTKFCKRTANKLLHIKFRSGKELKLTPEHPLLTVLGWRSAEELNIGGRIATPRTLPSFGNREMPEHKIKLLAYFIAEGCIRGKHILFSNSDAKIAADFKRSVKEFDSNLKVETHSNPGCFRVSQIKKRYSLIKAKRDNLGRFLGGSVRYNTPSIKKWLKTVGIFDLLSLDKHIPEEIFKLPKYQLALFLNRLFSCDGSIYKHKTTHGSVWGVSYSSSSLKLIKQVQHLLLRFGILSRLRHKKIKYKENIVESYELTIGTDNVEQFIREIGFHSAKQELQEQAIIEVANIQRNPNVDTIPKEIWQVYTPNSWAEIGRQLNYKIPKSLRESQRYSPSRQKLLQIAIADSNISLYQLAMSDIFWDEIIEINELAGNFTVYDISVPETHNFVANDIIVHNSYTLGVIAEGLANLDKQIRKNVVTIIFDTMGIYWTMKYPNYRDDKILTEWGLEPKSLAPRIFIPVGLFDSFEEKGIPVDSKFSIKPIEIEPTEWCSLFNIALNSNTGILIERSILKLMRTKDVTISRIIETIQKDERASEEEKNIAIARFETVENWAIFSEKGTNFDSFIKGGATLVLDLSAYNLVTDGQQIKELVISFISKRILKQRLIERKAEEVEEIREVSIGKSEQKAPLIWILIDEAHEFLPREGETLCSGPLIQLLREGRQPGISLVLTTQQPGKIHTDVLTQSDIVISHRLTAKLDVNALNDIMQTYLPFEVQKYLDKLQRVKGASIALDDNSEKIFPIQVQPRVSWHGGEDPAVIRKKSKESLFSSIK